MAFGFNRTKAFIVKVSGKIGNGVAEFALGFTEEIIFNVTRPPEAAAMDLIETENIKIIPDGNLAKTLSTAIALHLTSSQFRRKIFSIIAGATPNII